MIRQLQFSLWYILLMHDKWCTPTIRTFPCMCAWVWHCLLDLLASTNRWNGQRPLEQFSECNWNSRGMPSPLQVGQPKSHRIQYVNVSSGFPLLMQNPLLCGCFWPWLWWWIGIMTKYCHEWKEEIMCGFYYVFIKYSVFSFSWKNVAIGFHLW